MIKPLLQQEDGATLTEFGLVAPMFILMIMGVFDMAHTQYTRGMMNGAMQAAGRDLTLESAGSLQGSIDQVVIDRVQTVVPANATIQLEKLSHFEFADIGEAEEFDDDNGDGICNKNELFADANGKGQ